MHEAYLNLLANPLALRCVPSTSPYDLIVVNTVISMPQIGLTYCLPLDLVDGINHKPARLDWSPLPPLVVNGLKVDKSNHEHPLDAHLHK
jgi:hypothetical protein